MCARRFATVCLAAFVASSAAQAQSLAEVAKKAQEQRDKAKADAAKAEAATGVAAKDGKTTAAKTYTNRDLKDAAPPASLASSVPAPLAATDKAAADTPVESSKEVVKDEAYWRARWTPLHAKIGADLNKGVTLASRIYSLTVELVGIGPLNARRAGVEAERQRLITEAQTLDDTIRADKAALAAIEEEGRRAGALPGWFR